jgi:hypothetical protein
MPSSPDPELTANDVERLLLAFGRKLVAEGGGQFNEARLADALEHLVELHRAKGSPVDDLAEMGAGLSARPLGDGRIEVFLGFSDDDRRPRIRGRGVVLGTLRLDEMVRGPEG